MPDEHQVVLNAEGCVDQDLNCVGCGYNLRTLSNKASCAECGTPVQRTITAAALRFCDPDWLYRISRGFFWFGIAGSIALCIGAFVGIPLLLSTFNLGQFGMGIELPEWVEMIIIAGIPASFVVTLLWGAWRITTPEPKTQIRRKFYNRLRGVARWSLVMGLLLPFVVMFIAFFPAYFGIRNDDWAHRVSWVSGAAIGLVTPLLGLIGIAALLLILLLLAWRVKQRGLALGMLFALIIMALGLTSIGFRVLLEIYDSEIVYAFNQAGIASPYVWFGIGRTVNTYSGPNVVYGDWYDFFDATDDFLGHYAWTIFGGVVIMLPMLFFYRRAFRDGKALAVRGEDGAEIDAAA